MKTNSSTKPARSLPPFLIPTLEKLLTQAKALDDAVSAVSIGADSVCEAAMLASESSCKATYALSHWSSDVLQKQAEELLAPANALHHALRDLIERSLGTQVCEGNQGNATAPVPIAPPAPAASALSTADTIVSQMLDALEETPNYVPPVSGITARNFPADARHLERDADS